MHGVGVRAGAWNLTSGSISLVAAEVFTSHLRQHRHVAPSDFVQLRHCSQHMHWSLISFNSSQGIDNPFHEFRVQCTWVWAVHQYQTQGAAKQLQPQHAHPSRGSIPQHNFPAEGLQAGLRSPVPELGILNGVRAQHKNQKEPKVSLKFGTGAGVMAIWEVALAPSSFLDTNGFASSAPFRTINATVASYDTGLQQWICKPLMFPWFNHREDDRCLIVALPVVAFIEMLTKSVVSRATTATSTGCVQHGLSRNTPFSRWPKTQHTAVEHRGAQWKQDHRYWEASYKNKAFIIVIQETHCTTADKLVIPNFSLGVSVLSRNHGLATFVHERLEWSMISLQNNQRLSGCV